MNHLQRLSLLFILLAARGSTAKVLDTLVVQGLVVNQQAVVRTSAGLKPGAEFTPADVQDAINNLYRLGLFHTVDVYVANETDSSASLVIKVTENPVCESIEYAGNKKLKAKELEEKLTLKVGQVASDLVLFENAQALKKFYAEKGFLLAVVTPEQVPSKVPGNAIVKFRIDEGVKVRIKSIAFIGNKAFSSTRLKWKFKTKEDRWWRAGEYKEEEYRGNLDSIVAFYNDQGYLDAEIVKDSVRLADNKKDIFITLTIEEGRKYYVGDFFFTGNSILASDSLRERIALKKGRPFAKAKFDLTKFMVEDAYREEGYLWARVSDSKTYRGDTVDVTFDIAEGRAAVVNKVDITGNNKTMDKVIRREVVLYPGQKYKQSRMARSAREIMQLNYFNNVKPDIKPNDDGTIDLLFDIEEKDNVGQLSVGAAYSQRDKFMGTFTTSIPNFRGTGQELGLDVQFGLNRQEYAVTFKEPWAFDKPVSLLASVYYNMTNYRSTIAGSDLIVESYGFRLGAGRRLTWPDDYFRLDGIYQLSKEQESRGTRFFADSTLIVPQDGYVSRISLTLQRNDTDVPMFPNRGSIFALTPEVCGLGPDTIYSFNRLQAYRYLKTTLSYDWYFPLLWKLVLCPKTKFGIVKPFFGTDTVRISRLDLLSAGGVYADGTIRGYSDFQFGGQSATPATGITMLTLSAELRFPVLEQQLYVSVFGDMGNTWPRITDIDLADTYKGVGAGLRISVPMLGVLGFDFAWRLDDPYKTMLRNDPGSFSDRFQLHFIMNKPF